MKIHLTRLVSSLAVSAILLTCFPATAYAWGGTTRWPGVCPTHQHILTKSYQLLQSDPAFAGSGFPAIEQILAHEGVKWSGAFSLDLVGSNQYDIVGNGPDDETKTRYSDHYFNPLLNDGQGAGNAPGAAKDYYVKLVRSLQDRQPVDGVTAGQGAAWSAHFLADMYVPYHVVGMPGSEARALVSAGSHMLEDSITGPAFLYGRPVLPKTPANGWGGGDNFTKSMRRYVAYYKDMGPNANRDWYDPWYLNGLGFWDVKMWYSSHVRWEVYANKAYEKAPYAGTRELDAPAWLNASNGFDSTFVAQGVQVHDYTVKAAKECRDNIEAYWKDPAKGVYTAIESVYAMWRSSISAIRPELEVVPLGGDLYQVKTTVSNVADEAVQLVEMDLKVTGGEIQGQPRHEVTSIPGGGSITYSWQVTTPSQEQLHAEVEVIGTYQTTPDLQYARAETSTPLTVSVSPVEVKAGDDVTLTVEVDPPAVTQVDIVNPGPLDGLSDDVRTANDGIFRDEFEVKKDTVDGWYTIEAVAPSLNARGSARFYVGEKLPGDVTECTEVEVKAMVNGTWKRSDGSTPQRPFNSGSGGSTPFFVTGSFSGTTFAAAWDETIMASAGSMYPSQHHWGELVVQFDPTFTSVVSFTLQSDWEALEKERIDPVRTSVTVTATGIPEWDRRATYYGGHEVYYRVEQDAVCTDHSLSIKRQELRRDGTVDELASFTCEPTAGIAVISLNFRTPAP